MAKILVFCGMSLGGWIGWAIGESLSMVVAFVLSLLGSAIGLYYTRQWVRDLLP